MPWHKKPILNDFHKEIRRQVKNRARFLGFLLDGKSFINKSGKWVGKKRRFIWYEDDFVRYHALVMDDKDILAQVGGVTIEELNHKIKGWRYSCYNYK